MAVDMDADQGEVLSHVEPAASRVRRGSSQRILPRGSGNPRLMYPEARLARR